MLGLNRGGCSIIELEGFDSIFYEHNFEIVEEYKVIGSKIDLDKIEEILSECISTGNITKTNKPIDKGKVVSVDGTKVHVVSNRIGDCVDLFFKCFGRWYKIASQTRKITKPIADQVKPTCLIRSDSINRIKFTDGEGTILFDDGSKLQVEMK